MQALEYRAHALRWRAAERQHRRPLRRGTAIGREAGFSVSATREVQQTSRAQFALEGSFIWGNRPMTKGVDARVR